MALWTVRGDGRPTDGDAIAPQERLSWPRTIGFGAQHLVAMAGATILVPVPPPAEPAPATPLEGDGAQ